MTDNGNFNFLNPLYVPYQPSNYCASQPPHYTRLYIRTEEMDIDDEERSVTHKRMLYMLKPG